ncbi:ATP-binding protein [bacterium]|nr:ATP-binding protein [bacterium]
MERIQINQILKDIEKKIVFIVGPRQVGKTWLSKKVMQHFKHPTYLSFDSFEDQTIIKNETWSANTDLLVLDELHKMKNWKNYLKGLFDTKRESLKLLVTGSARLDTFRQSGDSLAGRYFIHHLFPFTIAELKDQKYSMDHYIERGGFPEPFLAENIDEANRWRKHYIDGLIRFDILDFERIHDFKAIKTIFELLRRNVGSRLSYSSISRDVNISSLTVQKYVSILEALFIIFRIYPYSRNIARSILKTPKVYFYDTGLVIGNEGIKFENHVALSLLQHVNMQSDYKGLSNELKYLRLKDGKEVDFCISDFDGIKKLIEVKLSKPNLSKNLAYFSKKYDLNGIQLVKNIKHERSIDKINIVNAQNFLKKLSF